MLKCTCEKCSPLFQKAIRPHLHDFHSPERERVNVCKCERVNVRSCEREIVRTSEHVNVYYVILCKAWGCTRGIRAIPA
jgi:hypothetical protein